MASQPWASFCLATYKRPERLAATLRAIAQQTMPDFEVIVSDNDPEGSAGPVVAALADPRLHYFRNAENLGMIGNFNAALSRASGQFVAMVTDDDPPYPHMLATLRDLAKQHPGYGTYYGAFDETKELERIPAAWGLRSRYASHLAAVPPGSVRTFNAGDFPAAFLTGRVFPVVLWSAGVVRRDLALAVGGLPDYGSPHLVDTAYVLMSGSQEGCATVNTVVARETIHGDNHMLRVPPDLYPSLHGFTRVLAARLLKRPDWNQLVPLIGRFGAEWAMGLGLLWRGYLHRTGGDSARIDQELAAIVRRPALPGVRRLYWRHLAISYAVAAYAFARRHSPNARRIR